MEDLIRGAALRPNLFVIGASKSGSSALHAYLGAHPQIAMSRVKEPCFFVDQEELREAWPIIARQACSHDLDAYLALWEGGEDALYRGEGSVYYSQAPHRSGVAARIAAACPDARIIYTVREPVERALAHYWQRFKELQELRPPEEAVREDALYRDTSDYAAQIEEYRRHFPAAQIKIVVAEELRTKRREVLADVINWLGLAPFEYADAQLTERHRSPPTSRRQRFAFVRHARNSWAWARLRKIMPSSWIDGLRQVSTSDFAKAEVDVAAARAHLESELAPRRAAFEALLGRKIDIWYSNLPTSD